MSESRFTEAEISAVLQEAENGAALDELCRRHGISEATLVEWRANRGNAAVSQERRLKELEEENQRLRSLVADLTLRNEALKNVMSKKW
nr:transposase [Chromatiaceae bacterium]MCP5313564.1 transposase [Chromatiaceae bacterium]